jgi:hypothetical protein
MAKVTLADGTVIEGTIEEFKQMGVKFPVEEVEAEPLKVGDYIVALESADYMYGVTDTSMELGIVTELCGDGDITIKIISHKDSSEVDCEFEVDTKYFRKATEEEVTTAKEKQANATAKLAEEMERKELEAKWAKIGRKPNEFKEGDAVQYKKAFTVVIGIKSGGIVAINQSNHISKNIEVSAEELTLVFPAETRFE